MSDFTLFSTLRHWNAKLVRPELTSTDAPIHTVHFAMILNVTICTPTSSGVVGITPSSTICGATSPKVMSAPMSNDQPVRHDINAPAPSISTLPSSPRPHSSSL